MNELNSDFVLWITLAALALTIASLIAFSWKAIRAMEGLEKEDTSEDESPEDKK